MADLPQNPIFGALSSAAFNIGAGLGARKRRQPVDLSKFANVRQAVQQRAAQPQVAQQPVQQRAGDRVSRFVKSGTETTPFGGSTSFERFHPGVDIAQPLGTPVPSFAGGRVTEVRRGQTQTPTSPGFGNFVIIEDRQGNKFRFSHLRNSLVRVGQEIPRGGIIGTVGNTGGAYSASGSGSGSHLDIRIRDAFGRYVDPSIYLR